MMKWRRRNSAGLASQSGADEVQNEAYLRVGKLDVLFGLQWVSTDEDGVKAELRAARKAGFASYVLSDDYGVLGLSRRRRLAGKDMPAHVAAALMFAEIYSSGGSEIFAIRFEDRYAVVALRDSRPLPGFDAVGDIDAMRALVDSFLRLPHTSQIRRCGSKELLGSAAEEIDWNVLSAGGGDHARLLPVPDPTRALVAAASIAVVGALAGGWFYYQWQLEKAAEAERLRKEQNPDYVYEQGIAQAMASAGLAGQPVLDSMVDAMKRVPLAVAGWGLTQVECTPSQCQAKWTRRYGTFADFELALPEPLSSKPDYVFKQPDLASATVTTRHPVLETKGAISTASAAAAASAGSPLVREHLPSMAQVATEFASRLQDYALVEVKVDAGAPALFGGAGDAAAVSRPVLSGTWKLDGPLWALDSVRVAEYTTVDKLVVDLKDASVERLNFSLSGNYYAKGKVY